jgi:hypothetical protein
MAGPLPSHADTGGPAAASNAIASPSLGRSSQCALSPGRIGFILELKKAKGTWLRSTRPTGSPRRMAEPGKPSCRLPDRHCEMPFLTCEESRGSITSTAAGFLLGAGAGATPARAAGLVSTAPVFAGSTQPSSRITIRVRRAVGSVRSTYPASVLCGCRSEAELVSLVSSPRLHPSPRKRSSRLREGRPRCRR